MSERTLAILQILACLQFHTILTYSGNNEVVWERLRSSESKHEYRFTIPRLPDNAPPQSVIAWLAATEIQQTAVIKDRLIVLGAIGGSANTVDIIDLGKPQLQVSFLCWNPQLSETGRYILYDRFYPRFADSELHSSVVGLFEVTASLEKTQGGELVASAFPPANLGRPIYPKDNAKRKSFDPLVSGENHFSFLSPDQVVWLDSDQVVVFVDRAKNKSGDKRVVVVVIRLANGDGDAVTEFPLSEPDRKRFLEVGMKRIDLNDTDSVARLHLSDGATVEVPIIAAARP